MYKHIAFMALLMLFLRQKSDEFSLKKFKESNIDFLDN